MIEKRKQKVYPLAIVVASIGLIEIVITTLYLKLSSLWEKIPVLIIILAIPISIVSVFIYLWIKKPGFLYPPSEFYSGDSPDALPMMFSSYHGIESFNANPELDHLERALRKGIISIKDLENVVKKYSRNEGNGVSP